MVEWRENEPFDSYASYSARGVRKARERREEPAFSIPRVLDVYLRAELDYGKKYAAERRMIMYQCTLPPAIGRVLRPGEVYCPRSGWYESKFSTRALTNEEERVKEILADVTAHHAARQAYFEECMKTEGGFHTRYREMDEINSKWIIFGLKLKWTGLYEPTLVDCVRQLEEKFPEEEMKKYPQLDVVTAGIMLFLSFAETEHGINSIEFITTLKLAMEKDVVKKLSMWEASLVLECCAAHQEIAKLVMTPVETHFYVDSEEKDYYYFAGHVSAGYGTLNAVDVCELMCQRLIWANLELSTVRSFRDKLQYLVCVPSAYCFIPKPPKPPVTSKSTRKPVPPLDELIPSFHIRHQKRVPR